jgi:NADPH-dependent curcumin reductase CurA
LHSKQTVCFSASEATQRPLDDFLKFENAQFRSEQVTQAINRQFYLAQRPSGLPTTDDVILRELPIPEPGVGEIVIRNLYMSLDPAIRGWMSDAPNYIEPIPVGSCVWATTIGRVVASNSPEFAVGDIALGMNGWEDYSLCAAEAASKIEDTMGLPLTNFLSILGSTGLTAYFGLLDIGKPQAGETLLVSGAAGAVGSLVGQIAKIIGCRVVGIAGGSQKCSWLLDECGFDEVIDYKTCGDLTAAIAEKCPDGVDIYWENVGGDMLDSVLLNLAHGARIPFCGWIATYNDAEQRPGPKNLWQLLAKSARMEGFLVLNYIPRFPEGIAAMAQWLLEGKLHHREHVVSGLENALDAFHMLFDGRNNGKLIINIGDMDD